MKNTDTEKLSKSLIYLSISLQSKIELWLTYRGFKPSCAINFIFRDSIKNHPLARRKLELWVARAKLKYLQDKKQESQVFVSKDHDKLLQLLACMHSESKNVVALKGKLFGYPRMAVKEFSEIIEQLDQEKIKPEETKLFFDLHLKKDIIKSLDWYPYMRYVPRKDHLLEDGKVAKKWAHIIRTELPSLAKRFEFAIYRANMMYNFASQD